MPHKYCSVETIQNELPSKYPQRVIELVGDDDKTESDYILRWNDEVAKIITHYSGYIDTMVGAAYPYMPGYVNKFPDITDTPPTPAVISEICYLYSLSKALSWFNTATSDTEDKDITTYKDRADRQLELIRKGEIQVSAAGSIAETFHLPSIPKTNQMTDGNFAKFGMSEVSEDLG